MKNRTKLIIAVCGVLVLLGGLLSLARHYAHKAPASEAAGQVIDKNTKHEDSVRLEAFENLEMDIRNADVELIESDHFELYHCYYGNCYEFQYEQKGDTLRVWDKENQKLQLRSTGFNFFGISFNSESGIFFDGELKSNRVKLYYPKGTQFSSVSLEADYGDVKIGALNADKADIRMSSGDGRFGEIYAPKLHIVNSYGDVSFDNSNSYQAQEISFELSSGDLKVKNLSAETLSFQNSYGDTKLQQLLCQKLKVQMSSGDLLLEDAAADTAELQNSYGEIEGRQLQVSSSLSLNASSGDVDLDGTLEGESKITASYGGVTLSLHQKREEVGYDLSASYGSISVDGEVQRDDEGDNRSHVAEGGGAPNRIGVSCSSGDVELNFKG